MLLLLLAAVQDVPVVMSGPHPRPASPWTEMVSGTCNGQVLEVLRPLYPLEAKPRLLINGLPVRGDTRQLIKDLDETGAAYRFEMLCSPSGVKAIGLRWHRGLFDGRGRVIYRAGSASFLNGAIVRSNSEEANEESFWYR